MIVPEGTTIICAKAQDGEVVVYCLVDTEAPPTSTLIIRTVYTGAKFDTLGTKYIDTVMLHESSTVIHVFGIVL